MKQLNSRLYVQVHMLLCHKGVCMYVCVCVNISQLYLVPYLLFFIYNHHTCTYTVISSKPIHLLPALLLRPAASPPPSPTSSSLPSHLRGWNTLWHSASCSSSSSSITALSFLPSCQVVWDSPKTRYQDNPSFLFCTLSCGNTSQTSALNHLLESLWLNFPCTEKIWLKPDIRNWDVELVCVSHWLTSDYFKSHYSSLFVGVCLGDIIYSLCLHFLSLTLTQTLNPLSPLVTTLTSQF